MLYWYTNSGAASFFATDEELRASSTISNPSLHGLLRSLDVAKYHTFELFHAVTITTQASTKEKVHMNTLLEAGVDRIEIGANARAPAAIHRPV